MIEAILDNIHSNRYPHDVLEMTGPNLYSRMLDEYFQEHPPKNYRIFGKDYEGKMKFKYWLSGFSFKGKEHWRESQRKGQY